MSLSHDNSQDSALAANFVFTTDSIMPAVTESLPTHPAVTHEATPSEATPHEATPHEATPHEATPHEAGAAAVAPLPKRNRTIVWDVPFDRVTLPQAVERIEQLIERGHPSYVITANLNYVMLHHHQASISPITAAADLILADGQPIVWRSKLTSQPLPERVAGSEMIYHLAQQASVKGWGIYFLGGQPGVAATCAERLSSLYPGLKIAGVESPPFRSLSAQEQADQDERIRNSGAKLLLVAFGQPKGERWIHEHSKRLGIPVSIQLGASFDFIAGTAKRAPAIWQRVGLEWAYRMLSDPRRLVPRYSANACFLLKALVQDWKRKVTSWGLGDWTDPSRS